MLPLYANYYKLLSEKKRNSMHFLLAQYFATHKLVETETLIKPVIYLRLLTTVSLRKYQFFLLKTN